MPDAVGSRYVFAGAGWYGRPLERGGKRRSRTARNLSTASAIFRSRWYTSRLEPVAAGDLLLRAG